MLRWSDKHKRDLIEGKKLMKLAEFKEKYIGDRAFYKRYLYLALPMIVQNAITNLVSFLDNSSARSRCLGLPS